LKIIDVNSTLTLNSSLTIISQNKDFLTYSFALEKILNDIEVEVDFGIGFKSLMGIQRQYKIVLH
jgi:hypothetical protein